MKVSDILAQKIAEIESRLPVKLKGSSKDSFASVLGDSMTSQTASNAPIIDSALLESTKSSTTKYPLVSGSYESVYPRLSQTEIQELMPRIDAAIEAFSEQFNVDPPG